jgi:FAD/FMN-containing dehydrogenase
MVGETTIEEQLIRPDHATYDEARATFNGTIDRRPAAILQPRSTADVVAGVRWARASGLPIAVRGGGHGVAGHAVADDALVVDLRYDRAVTVDRKRRRAVVRGGATWLDVDGATVAHGLAMPGGTFGDTGVAGLALGGGIGYLMGTGGLTCDNTVRAEVVTADGSVVTAGDGGDPELLWALRGGGGNFGVVTEFEFALRPVGPIYGGRLIVPLAASAEALATVAEFCRIAPPEVNVFAAGPSGIPNADGSPPAVRDELRLGLAVQAPRDDAEVMIRPLRRLPIVRDELQMMSYLELQGQNSQLPFGLRHYWKGHFVRDFDGGAISAIVDGLAGAPDPASFVLMEAITGAARDEPSGGAAFGQREARWNVSALAIWADPAADEGQVAWARSLTSALEPSSLSGAGYANYASADETPTRVRAAFGPERFARLAAVKRRYDPDNVFRFNLNIPPTG